LKEEKKEHEEDAKKQSMLTRLRNRFTRKNRPEESKESQPQENKPSMLTQLKNSAIRKTKKIYELR
jgi:hypothetical protein